MILKNWLPLYDAFRNFEHYLGLDIKELKCFCFDVIIKYREIINLATFFY